MLDPQCPTMGMVTECGFTERNCFGTDIFPLHFDLNRDYTDNPFHVFGEFKWLFMKKHVPGFLKLGGDVLLVFGDVAFDILYSYRRLQFESLGKDNEHLNIYTERVISIRYVSWLTLGHRFPSRDSTRRYSLSTSFDIFQLQDSRYGTLAGDETCSLHRWIIQHGCLSRRNQSLLQ